MSQTYVRPGRGWIASTSHWVVVRGVEVRQSLRASPVFSLVVLVTLALFALIGLMLFGGLLGVEAIAAMGHFGSLSHRTHDLTYSFLFGVTVTGLLIQLRVPSRNVAGQFMALIPWVSFVAAFALGGILGNLFRPPFVPIFGGLAFLATIIHPKGRSLFDSFSISRVNWVTLALVIIAAVPLLIFASTNIVLQRTATDAHATQSHYGYMAAFSFAVIGVGLLASLRSDGWWLPAWAAGFLPVLLGLASLVFPDAESSLSLIWALAAIVWGVAFIAAAEFTQEATRPTLLGSRLPKRVVIPKGDIGVEHSRRATPTPRWANVLGVIGIVAVLLVVVNMVTGVASGGVTHGPGLHSSGGDQRSNPPPIQGASELAITGDDLAFDSARIELTVGEPINIALTSADTLHDLTVDEIGFQLVADRNETVIGGLMFFEPGTYVGYCSVPGHREAGMELQIVATPPDSPRGHTPPVQHRP